MPIDRRQIVKSFLAGAALCALPRTSGATVNASLSTLANGFRLHVVRTQSNFVNAMLILRSDRLFGDAGLGHIMEHTSFVGAAGPYSAAEVKENHQDIFQESNATTQPGMISWESCLLPDNLGPALRLLALTSLEQQFDVETVASEARVVLQELYLDKYAATRRAEHDMTVALLGRDHPHARDTTDEEIAKAQTTPNVLAAELRDFAGKLRLPGNMDLFVAGDIDAAELDRLVTAHFGGYAAASGPILNIPPGAVTRAHKRLIAKSTDITAPLSQIKIAWNTGVRAGEPDAAVLTALGDYINRKLCLRLRERYGDSYTPEANFEPDAYSGIFTISVDTASSTSGVERRIFETLEETKVGIDAKELKRFRDRAELTRRKNAQDNDACIGAMLQRITEGASRDDLRQTAVTADQLMAAARQYLPSYRGAYVRLVLVGQAPDGGTVANARRN